MPLSLNLRWTSCRCVWWRWQTDQVNLSSTWSITSRANTSNITPTPASSGTTTSDLPRRWVTPTLDLDSYSASDLLTLIIRSLLCPSGFQSLQLWAVGTPADRGGHPGCRRSLHWPSDSHRDGDRLWRRKSRFGFTCHTLTYQFKTKRIKWTWKPVIRFLTDAEENTASWSSYLCSRCARHGAVLPLSPV